MLGTRNALLLAMILLPVHATQADDDVERYFDVWPYYVDADSARSADSQGAGIRAALGRHWRNNLFVEFQGFGSVIESGVPGATDYYMSGLGVDLVYAAHAKRRFSPFLLIGAGVDYNDVQPDSEDDTSGYANVALGLTSGDLTQHGLRLRAEARYVYDFFADGYGDWHLGLGLSIPFGRTRETIVERTVEVPVEVIVEKEVPIDTDMDDDGVLDDYDFCPNTLAKARVDRNGCMLTAQTVTLQGVNFEYNSSRLTTYAEQTLQGVARALRDQPGIQIEIAGHTDSRGADTYNLNLSRARAQAVNEFLIALGISDERLVARGYGETQPVSSNDTDAGRANNRRVELRIKGSE